MKLNIEKSKVTEFYIDKNNLKIKYKINNIKMNKISKVQKKGQKQKQTYKSFIKF